MFITKFLSLVLTLVVVSVMVTGCGTSNAISDESEFDENKIARMLSEQLKTEPILKDEQMVVSRLANEVEQEETEETTEAAPSVVDSSEKEAEVEEEEKTNDTNEEGMEDEEVIRGTVPFRIIPGNELASKHANAHQYVMSLQNTDVRDWKVFSADNEAIIVISSGLKNTGGYTIEVLSITNEEGRSVIKVRESSPPPGAIVTQAFTNPTVVVAVDSKNLKDVIVVDEFGTPFQTHGGSYQ